MSDAIRDTLWTITRQGMAGNDHDIALRAIELLMRVDGPAISSVAAEPLRWHSTEGEKALEAFHVYRSNRAGQVIARCRENDRKPPLVINIWSHEIQVFNGDQRISGAISEPPLDAERTIGQLILRNPARYGFAVVRHPGKHPDLP